MSSNVFKTCFTLEKFANVHYLKIKLGNPNMDILILGVIHKILLRKIMLKAMH